MCSPNLVKLIKKTFGYKSKDSGTSPVREALFLANPEIDNLCDFQYSQVTNIQHICLLLSCSFQHKTLTSVIITGLDKQKFLSVKL